MNSRLYATATAILISLVTLTVLLGLMGQAAPVGLCAAPQDAPTVTAADPSSAPNDLDTPIVITGTGFTPGLSGTLVVTSPNVWLGNALLPDAGWVSSTTLTATVPWGLDPGMYTLTVVNADGQSGSLPNAFTVTQGIGVWTTGGPYGGSIRHIAINPLTPTTLYAAIAPGAGLFRSRDGGANWELVFAELLSGKMDIAPRSPDTVYVGSGAKGPYRSDDGGDTWVAIPIKETGGYCLSRVFAHPTLSETIYATLDCDPSYRGVWMSNNRGQTWLTRTNGLMDTQVEVLAFDPTDPLKMYAGTVSGNVFRSLNGGEFWQFFGQPDSEIMHLAVDPFGAHEVWAASGRGYLGKYTSGSWVSMLPAGAGGVDAIAFDQHISGTMWIGGPIGSGGLKSIDGGSTWIPFGKTQPAAVGALAVHPTDSRIVYEGFVGDGIFKTSDDGATWQEANHGLAGLVSNGLATAPGSPGTVYATVQGTGIFKTNDGGKIWLKLAYDGLGARSPAIDPVTPTRVYVTVSGGVDISEDGGSHWHLVDTPVPSQYADRYGIERSLLAANPKQPGHLVLGVGFVDKHVAQEAEVAGGIYTSTDYGETWSFVDVSQEISPVVALAFDPFAPTVVYAGTGNFGSPGTGVWKSTDGGATWAPSGLSGLNVSGIAVDHRGSQTVYAVARGAFYVSHDAGQTWTQATDSIGMDGRLLYVPTEPPVLYVYSWTGVMRSTDGGYHWSRAAGTLAYTYVDSMVAVATEDRVIVYIGTSGGTVSGGAEQLQSEATGETLVSAGVYRYTTRLLNRRVYLPVILKGQ